MTSGPYAICFSFFESSDSDAPTYRTIKYGYDTAKQAFDAIAQVSVEADVPKNDFAVIRLVDADEADDFTQ